MRRALHRKGLYYAILAALAVGGFTLPTAGAAGSDTHKSLRASAHATTHKRAPVRTPVTTKSAKAKATKSTAPKSPAAKSVMAKSSAGKSARAKSRTPRSGKSSPRNGSRRVKGQAAPTAERISEIQEALAKRGAYAGNPSGKWDDDTVDAMKKFQSSHGLKSSGKLDAPTLQKLGLGSETTGLGAPTPPPNSAANRLLSKTVTPEPQE